MISATNPADIKRAFDVINNRERGLSYRELSDVLSLPKSTLFDRELKYQAIVNGVISSQSHNRQEAAILNQIFLGKCSVRDAVKVVNLQENCQLHRNNVTKTLVSLSKAAEKVNQKDRKMVNNIIKALGYDELFRSNTEVLRVSMCLSTGFLGTLEFGGKNSQENWEKTLEQLDYPSIEPVSHTTDAGTSVRGAVKNKYPSNVHIRDLFHVIQKLKKACARVENYAYHKIQLSYKNQTEESLVEMETIVKLFDLLEEKIKQLRKFCYFCCDGCVEICFSNDLKKSIEAVSDIFEKILQTGLTHGFVSAAKTYIDNGKDEILVYKRTIESLVLGQIDKEREFSKLDNKKKKELLFFLCAKVEAEDQIQRSYENSLRKEKWKRVVDRIDRKIEALVLKAEAIANSLKYVKKTMSEMKKSNSLVECLNGILRRYLRSYKSVPKWFSELFIYFWNHRPFDRGKRKGYSPIDLAMGIEKNSSSLEDCWNLLQKEYEKMKFEEKSAA